MPDGLIRPVRPDDIVELLEMVRELAAYEQAADQLIATPRATSSFSLGTTQRFSRLS